jgi:hypothetical protein
MLAALTLLVDDLENARVADPGSAGDDANACARGVSGEDGGAKFRSGGVRQFSGTLELRAS